MRLDLNWSIRGLGILILVCSLEELIGKKCGLMKVECFQTLLYFSLVCHGRIFSRLSHLAQEMTVSEE